MRALLIANASDADAGFVGERFRHHGYAFAECHREHADEWPDLEGYDLVLSLGSDWSVYWEHLAAEVAAEAALLQAAHRRGTPTFGICYGSQITARALGGEVRRGDWHELGWFTVESDRPVDVAPGPWFQWHGDVVTPPPGSTVIARNELCPQTWTTGRTCCTQFHPEVTESIVRRWLRGGATEARELGHDPEQVLERTRELVEQSRPAANRLVDWYLETVAAAEHP